MLDSGRLYNLLCDFPFLDQINIIPTFEGHKNISFVLNFAIHQATNSLEPKGKLAIRLLYGNGRLKQGDYEGKMMSQAQST